MWKLQMDSIDSDTNKVVIGFNPTLLPIVEEIDYARRFLRDTVLVVRSTSSLVLPFKKDIVIPPFKIVTDLKQQEKNRLSFSRILFNKSKTMGVLDVGFTCSGNCGKGYFVPIKKGFNGKWFVSKVRNTWIS
ncbi:hypothetical protein ABDK00_000080 [Niabella insulamsoli]|uniref:hypothetical protein n=1 Tax=Niabella insulamsoli TaxID=3144874 RepID=UPI0031FE4270